MSEKCSHKNLYVNVYSSPVHNCHNLGTIWASQVALVVKNPPANSGDVKDRGHKRSRVVSGSSSGGEPGNPLHYSCLENLMDREACHGMVHMIRKSQTQFKQLNMHRYNSDVPFRQSV